MTHAGTTATKFAIIIIFLIMLSAPLSAAYNNNTEYVDDTGNWAFTFYPALSAYSAIVTSVIYSENRAFIAGFSLEVEHRLNSYFSIPAEIRVIAMDTKDAYVNMLGLAPGIRFYPAGEAMKGLFFGHYIQFVFGRADGFNNMDNYDRIYFGLPHEYISTTWIGYRFLFTDFHFELSIGFAAFYPIENRERESFFAAGYAGLGFGVIF